MVVCDMGEMPSMMAREGCAGKQQRVHMWDLFSVSSLQMVRRHRACIGVAQHVVLAHWVCHREGEMGERDAGPRHGWVQAWQVSHSMLVSGGGGDSCVCAFLFLASSSVEAQIALCSVVTMWLAFSYAHSLRRRERLFWVSFHVSVCLLFITRAIVSWMCAISLAIDLVLAR